MTLKDFLKRVDIEKDGDKVLMFRDSNDGWCNLKNGVGKVGNVIIIWEDTSSPFSDGG